MKNTTVKLLATAALILSSMQPVFAKTLTKEFSESVTVERTVVSVDKVNRTAVLSDDAGTTKTIKVGDAIKNLDNVKAGDKVKATYSIYIQGQLRKPTKEELANPLVVEASGGHNNNPNAPAGSLGDKITVVTTIVAVDKQNMSATLEGPNGRQLTIHGDNPKNAKQIKVGNTVIITYQERLFLSLEPVAK